MTEKEPIVKKPIYDPINIEPQFEDEETKRQNTIRPNEKREDGSVIPGPEAAR